MLTILSVILISSLFIIKCFLQRKYNYWKKRNILSPKPSLLFGNYRDYILQKKDLGVVISEICEQHPEEPKIGVFYGTEPALIVQDPELLKLITTKDYYYFNAREISAHTEKESNTRNLFFTYGDKWKVLRQNLTPLFTSAKMKNMFPLIEICSKKYELLLDEMISKNPEQETKTLIMRFTMDCICSCAFGIDAKCMESEEPSNLFRKLTKLLMPKSALFSFKGVLRATWPTLFYSLGLSWFSPRINQLLGPVLSQVFNERKTRRNDMVDCVMEWKDKSYIYGDSIDNMKNGRNDKCKIKVDHDLLVTQCALYFSGGFETSSLTSTYLLFELAKNPELQEKALAEVDAYITTRGGCLQYDCTSELPFLSQCIEETLRLYPLQTMLAREVYDEYTLDGLKLVKGDRIHLPILRLQRNPKYFPDPMTFKPDRFSPENRKNIIPFTYMPLGEGPRLCIGFRFGKMQILAGLVTVLKKYRLELAEGMSREVTFEPRCRTATSTQAPRLNFIIREGWEERVFKNKSP